MVASILDNPEKIIKLIEEKSGLSKEEIEERIRKKQEDFGGLLTRAGAAYALAKDLDLNFEEEFRKQRITDIKEGSFNINLEAEVLKVFPTHFFKRNGEDRSVRNLIISDDSGTSKLVLWNKDIDISEGDKIRISNAYSKNNEIHLGDRGYIHIVNKAERKREELSKISELKIGEHVKVRAFVTRLYRPSVIRICASCGAMMKEDICQNCGAKESKHTLILNMELDDGSSTIRATMYRYVAEAFLGISGDEMSKNQKLFDYKLPQLIGVEKIFTGDVRKNNYMDSSELIVRSFEDVNVDKEIERLILCQEKE